MNQQTETNLPNECLLWVAKQIGYGEFLRDSTKEGIDRFFKERFNLTSDIPQAAYDREKVRDWLGEKHGAYLIPFHGAHGGTPDGWGWEQPTVECTNQFNTYEEAAGAACIAVERE